LPSQEKVQHLNTFGRFELPEEVLGDGEVAEYERSNKL
jgi:hypothetical protein